MTYKTQRTLTAAYYGSLLCLPGAAGGLAIGPTTNSDNLKNELGSLGLYKECCSVALSQSTSRGQNAAGSPDWSYCLLIPGGQVQDHASADLHDCIHGKCLPQGLSGTHRQQAMVLTCSWKTGVPTRGICQNVCEIPTKVTQHLEQQRKQVWDLWYKNTWKAAVRIAPRPPMSNCHLPCLQA